MRKQIVAGNWKMNTTFPDGFNLVKEVINKSAEAPKEVELIVCPPFTHLVEFTKATQGTRIHVGAQNCAMWEKGAYTGEISATMLKSINVEYVILGHSERREYFGETSEILLKKLLLAFEFGLTPIFCCGEKLDERESNNHFNVVKAQIEETLNQLSPEQMQKVIIAYEPVWAIGTGKTATSDQAQEMHAHIRSLINSKFGADIAQNTSILYGGSCKPSNAAEIFSKPDVDGGLIGGAALNASDFIAIAKGF